MFEKNKAVLNTVREKIEKKRQSTEPDPGAGCTMEFPAEAAESGSGTDRTKEFPADVTELSHVLGFLDECLEEAGCGMKEKIQLEVALEEMFVNIAHYAYGDRPGKVDISFRMDGNAAIIELRDEGVPFDPTKKKDPDTTLSAEKRKIGGLGIYMVKKSMDAVGYMRTETENILTLRKTIRK